MDKAPGGVVYFSLGAEFRSTDLPVDKIDSFLEVFATMKETIILWKFESIELREKQPPNVVIGTWLPQQEILSHPNLKLFITNGGHLSHLEAIFYAVPILGIPFCNDQQHNLARSVEQGNALLLDYQNISAESVKDAIDTIINDKR